jgi:hypothetical protein
VRRAKLLGALDKADFLTAMWALYARCGVSEGSEGVFLYWCKLWRLRAYELPRTVEASEGSRRTSSIRGIVDTLLAVRRVELDIEQRDVLRETRTANRS